MARSRASAPGKLILMGEHAAVYGRPALVAALDLRCRVEVSELPGNRLELSLPDLGIDEETTWTAVREYSARVRRRWQEFAADPATRPFGGLLGGDRAHLVKVAAGEAAREAGIERPPGARLRLTSSIPRGGGFGSSAALAVALPAALFAAWSEPAESERLDRVALEIERRQHGLPSGVDHATVLAGGVVRARREADGTMAVEPLPVGPTALRGFRIYHTGEAPDSTGDVVASVRERFAQRRNELDELLGRMETATIAFAREVARADAPAERALGAAIRDFEACLESLGVVPSTVRATIRAFEAAGGAAKISGAGSARGPGAGALLALPSSSADSPLPDWLPHLAPVSSVLGAPGLAVETLS